MEQMPKEVMTREKQMAEKELALLLQKTISDITRDTTEVSWNALEVSSGIPEYSLEPAQVQQVSEHTIILARSVFFLWKNHRHDLRVSKDGNVVAVSLEELLQDLQKQAHDEGSEEKRIQEESAEQRQHVLTNLQLLAACHVQGSCTLTGRSKKIALDGSYLRYSTVSRKIDSEKSLIGFLLSPGEWMHTYEEALR